MKLAHIVNNSNVFFKYDNGPYRTMPSGVIDHCSWKFTIFDGVRYFDHNFMKLSHSV